ncbi:MAG: hypothetical protein U5R14_05125 [Gemmatimonadota bacterium]|nr:hypothetical protein [Gemmatimonadota bacterium]
MLPLLTLTLVVLWAPTPSSAQAVSEPGDTAVVTEDADDVRGAARAAQGRYERRRARHFPRTLRGSGGPCDETVGRFCTWYGEGNWVPEPEAPEIAELRTALLVELDTLQPHAPGDPWILGQRVWYRAERGDWDEALDVARTCPAPQRAWWCAALDGFALHGLERFPEAERAFAAALWEMDLERAWSWRVPERAVDGEGRDVLTALRSATTDSVELVLDRLWALADPLYLIDGNDRKTAHFARWTVATLREDARTPYGIPWGGDLEELLVRHGWELGWEREPGVRITDRDRVIGHKHPAGRDFLPGGAALRAPARTEPADHVPTRVRPRSLYAPPYAPVLLPMDVQVAVFPRGRAFRVVATHDLPRDTTRRAREDIPRPWMEPGNQAGLADRAGLFLLDAVTGEVTARTTQDTTVGALVLEGAEGEHVLSVESWSPEQRRAGRLRLGITHVEIPDDIPVLSDILLVAPGEEPVEGLEEAAGRALTAPAIQEGASVGIVWEVTGLGFRRETLTFDLTIERTDPGLLQRVGSFLGLADPDRPLALQWEEAGPDEPGPMLRHLDLDLPELDPGQYEIRLELRTAGRDPVTRSRAFDVRPTPR